LRVEGWIVFAVREAGASSSSSSVSAQVHDEEIATSALPL
jgi:hypothetical protein